MEQLVPFLTFPEWMSGTSVLISAGLQAVYLVAGVALFVAPFRRSGRTAPQWTRVARWIGGPMAVCFGVLGLVLIFARESLSRDGYTLTVHFRMLCAGIALGALIVLFASGELVPGFLRRSAKR